MSKHDLFISYTHIDNEQFDADHGWIDLLHERLDVRLRQLLGERPQIWRDRKLKGSDLFGPEIFTSIAQSELLLSVLSPRYLTSDWCPQELRSFYRQKVQNSAQSVSRLFKVVKTPIPREDHPVELQGMTGYEFYEEDAASGRFREYSNSKRSEPNYDPRYWSKLEDLAQDLAAMIKKARLQQDPAPSPNAASAGKTIYLAETTSDLREQRDRVRRELELNGHRVLPETPLPTTWHLREEVQRLLSECQLAVHLIGTSYGIIPEDETLSMAEIQHELAAVRNRDAAFTQILWLPSDVHPTNERQQNFITNLLNSSTDLLRGKLEDLKNYIHEKLNPPPVSLPAPSAPNGNGQHESKLVYLCCDQPDYESAAPLEELLYQRGFDVLSDSQLKFDELRLCDALLVYCSNTTDSWLNFKKMDLFKLRGYERDKPLLAKAFYISGPQTVGKERFRLQEELVIKNYGEVSPAALLPFIEQIERGPRV